MKEIAVKFTIQMLIEDSDSLPMTIPIHTIERACERIEVAADDGECGQTDTPKA